MYDLKCYKRIYTVLKPTRSELSMYIKTHRSNLDLFDVVKIVPLLKNKSAQELDGVDM